MEQKVTPPWMIALITSLACIVINIAAYAMNQLTNKSFGNIQILLVFGVVIWACIFYAKQMQGQVSYGNVFAHGFKVTAGIAALLAIYIFVSVKFIYPEIIDLTIEQSRIEMEKVGKLTTDQIDEYLKLTRNNFLSFSIGFSIFFIALVGVIGSLIGAGFAKKNPTNPFQNAS